MEEIIDKCQDKWVDFTSLKIDFDYEVHVLGDMGRRITSFDSLDELLTHLNE